MYNTVKSGVSTVYHSAEKLVNKVVDTGSKTIGKVTDAGVATVGKVTDTAAGAVKGITNILPILDIGAVGVIGLMVYNGSAERVAVSGIDAASRLA